MKCKRVLCSERGKRKQYKDRAQNCVRWVFRETFQKRKDGGLQLSHRIAVPKLEFNTVMSQLTGEEWALAESVMDERFCFSFSSLGRRRRWEGQSEKVSSAGRLA